MYLHRTLVIAVTVAAAAIGLSVLSTAPAGSGKKQAVPAKSAAASTSTAPPTTAPPTTVAPATTVAPTTTLAPAKAAACSDSGQGGYSIGTWVGADQATDSITFKPLSGGAPLTERWCSPPSVSAVDGSRLGLALISPGTRVRLVTSAGGSITEIVLQPKTTAH